MSKLPKIPIVRPFVTGLDVLSENLSNILTSGVLTKGHWLSEFEKAAAEHLQVKHAIAVSSCTTGLTLAYRALDLHGEAIIPSFTFMATASALVWAGVKPVFVESDFHTRNVDPETIAEHITTRTSAIVAVHNFGNPAPIAELQELANQYNLKLILDAAHAFGATYRDEPIGSQGDVQVFSLSPTKLVIAGEGGIIATNCDELAMRLRIAREYGNDGAYDTVTPGLNGRLPEISALIGIESLRRLSSAVENRNAYADFYQRELGKLPGIGFQQVSSGDRSAYKDFCITVDKDQFGLSRDELMIALAAENIDSRSYYNPPVHLQTAYRRFACHDLPVTEKLARECLSLPMWSEMESEILERVCATIEGIQRKSQQRRPRLGTTDQVISGGAQRRAAPDASPSVMETRIPGSVAANGKHDRDILFEALLGRPTVQLDQEVIQQILKDKVVLVTGAGGSIGSEIARQLAAFPLQTFLLLDRTEHGLFLIERELLANFPGAKTKALVADICDARRMNSIFRSFAPQVIFHAAAHKHVPLMETNVVEAVKNNIIGTFELANAAGKFAAETFVLISTDKAVRPASIMGATKRVAELIIQEMNQSFSTRFLAVRFGNVIGSNGSVVTIFREQISKGGPVTVTHPEMERYFMTPSEAASLVLQAAAIGEGGEILILDMGRPVKIIELAKEVIRRSGLQPETDIQIIFSGMRPGEKLREQLQSESEQLAKTNHPKIFVDRISGLPSGTIRKAVTKINEIYLSEDEGLMRDFLGSLLLESDLMPRSEAACDVSSTAPSLAQIDEDFLVADSAIV